MVISELRIKIGREGGKTFSLLQQSAVVRKRLLHWDPGVVGWCESAVYLTSLGRLTDIGLQLGKACYPCSG